ncbi:hypothetical protein Patl1_28159 [Pistacia atlantica]|uniref:Uncharacterized protein n=1 Tax=Pistacia atlantica TaxID=434234 RepID=A0ACC1BGE6_9ROSI|nr:hypothetical protein Patl1_28159 [Pistacia atlantica]
MARQHGSGDRVDYAFNFHFPHSILQADSSLRRSDEEIALLDSYTSIKSNLVIKSGKKLQRKRAHSPHEDENDSIALPCPQCGTEVSGFRCNPNTVHLQCHACGGMMPSRTDINVPQHCVGCDRAFCGAYWHAQVVNRSDIHPMCSHDTFKPISERTLSRIPFVAHEMNQHEQDITERCIRQTGRTLQDVISDWIGNECYDKLVSFLLYWFRITTPKYCLPEDVRQREDCWYGHACRTQHHNEEHARKRNHVCRPTRGTH